jgi:hypothetical protein
MPVTLTLREQSDSGSTVAGRVRDTVRLRDTGWKELRVRYQAKTNGSALDLTIRSGDISLQQALLVDRVTLRKVVAGDSGGSGTSGMPPVCGTWVLQQASSVAELKRLRPNLMNALRTPGVRGLSVRVPWASIDRDFSVLEKAKRIARAAGKPLSVRFMAGRSTPARVFQEGAHYYVNSRGEKIPQPFSNTGRAGNPVFEREYEQLVARLASWSRHHNVSLLHLSWYSHMWAEIDNGPQLQNARGYSLDAWKSGHLRLLDIGLSYARDGLSVEFPMSGHWGNGASAAGDFLDRIVASKGRWSPRVFVQGNGLGRYESSPAWSRPIHHGLQMYDGGAYDWSSVFAYAKSVRTTYLEVYSSSFQGSRAESLATEAKEFRARFNASCRYA